jgi:hypothetical protein
MVWTQQKNSTDHSWNLHLLNSKLEKQVFVVFTLCLEQMAPHLRKIFLVDTLGWSLPKRMTWTVWPPKINPLQFFLNVGSNSLITAASHFQRLRSSSQPHDNPKPLTYSAVNPLTPELHLTRKAACRDSLLGILLLKPCNSLIYAWKINKWTNYSFRLLIMYGRYYMFRHYIAIFRERS